MKNKINVVEENVIYWAKRNPSVKIPMKNDEDAGFDVYANFTRDYIVIQPNTTEMIPTGLHCALNEGWMIKLMERGSTGTKGIGQRCGVIDSGFRNEIFVPLTNHNDRPIVIVKKEILGDSRLSEIFKEHYIVYPYEKAICQAVAMSVPKLNCIEITVEELKTIPSKRGEGMLGSSNK